MISTANATQFATGLFHAAASPDEAVALAEPLAQLSAALTSHRELVRALKSPNLPIKARVSTAAAILDHLGAPELIKSLVKLLVRRDEFRNLPPVAEAYQRLVDEHRGVKRADVRLARDASDEELGEIAAALKHAIGSDVELKTSIDPQLIGGFVARVGDLVYDASLSRQLGELRTTLLNA